MKPTPGRIVHFIDQGSPEHLPAIICMVHPPGAHRSDPVKDGTLLNLGVWGPTGSPREGVPGVPEDQTAKRPLSWHWPEREEQDAAVPALGGVVMRPEFEQLQDRVMELENGVGPEDDDGSGT